jgi:hypothetical protein
LIHDRKNRRILCDWKWLFPIIWLAICDSSFGHEPVQRKTRNQRKAHIHISIHTSLYEAGNGAPIPSWMNNEPF